MPEHNILTDPYLHEPKGVAAAIANKVYVSDGAGSGAWKKAYTQGWENYNDSGSSQALTSGSYVKLTNNAAGAQTLTSYILPGASTMWNSSTNQLNLSNGNLAIGDTLNIRVDVNVTTTTNQDVFALRLKLGVGATPYYLQLDRRQVKTAGTNQYVFEALVYIGNTLTLVNPVEIEMYTDGTGNSVVVNGWTIRSLPRNPVYS